MAPITPPPGLSSAEMFLRKFSARATKARRLIDNNAATGLAAGHLKLDLGELTHAPTGDLRIRMDVGCTFKDTSGDGDRQMMCTVWKFPSFVDLGAIERFALPKMAVIEALFRQAPGTCPDQRDSILQLLLMLQIYLTVCMRRQVLMYRDDVAHARNKAAWRRYRGSRPADTRSPYPCQSIPGPRHPNDNREPDDVAMGLDGALQRPHVWPFEHLCHRTPFFNDKFVYAYEFPKGIVGLLSTRPKYGHFYPSVDAMIATLCAIRRGYRNGRLPHLPMEIMDFIFCQGIVPPEMKNFDTVARWERNMRLYLCWFVCVHECTRIQCGFHYLI